MLIIEADIATTQLVEQILCHLKDFGLSYRKRLLVELKASDFTNGELPLVVRSCDPLLGYWLRIWRAAGIPFVFYLDDNFWHIEGDTELARYYQHPMVRKTLELTVAQAKLVLTNSSYLAAFLTKWSNAVNILPPPFSFELIDGLFPYCGEEQRIGFAGSPSRAKDLEIIAPIIAPLLDRYPNLFIEFAGALPHGVSPGSRIRFFPHVNNYKDYIHFQIQRGWSVGWAPLFDTVANRSKTNNKYREYAACGIAGVYTDIPPYQGTVQQRRTGLLVGNHPDAWLHATEQLLNDSMLRRRIVHRAYLDAHQQHSLPVVAGRWLKMLQDASESVPILEGNVARLRFSTLYWCLQVWVQIGISYQEGGFGLVLKRSLYRVGRGIINALKTPS